MSPPVTIRLLDYGETPPIFKSKRKRSCLLPGLYRMLLLFLECVGAFALCYLVVIFSDCDGVVMLDAHSLSLPPQPQQF